METATGGKPVHGPGGSLGRAVVCVSADGPRSQILCALEDSRYEVLAEVDRGLELLPPVAEFAPDVVVLDLALVGSLGLRLFTLIKSLAPLVAIVVFAPLQTFHVAAMEAGAHAVVCVTPRRVRRDRPRRRRPVGRPCDQPPTVQPAGVTMNAVLGSLPVLSPRDCHSVGGFNPFPNMDR